MSVLLGGERVVGGVVVVVVVVVVVGGGGGGCGGRSSASECLRGCDDSDFVNGRIAFELPWLTAFDDIGVWFGHECGVTRSKMGGN